MKAMIAQFAVIISALMLSAAAYPFGNSSRQDSINPDPLSVESIKLTPSEIRPDKDTELKIYFDLANGFHAYVEQFKVEILSHPEFILGELYVAPVVEFQDPVSKKKKAGTEGHGSLSAYFKAPGGLPLGDITLQIQLTYQACTKDYCLFPKKILTQKTATVAVDGHAEDPLTRAMQKGLLAAYLLAFFAGVLTSFTPCIFPMIPITLAVLGTKNHARSRLRGLTISLMYVFGIALTYAILGVAAAKTGALFGSALGHPAVVIAISSLFVLMGLSMYGLFEVKLPDTWTNKIAGQKVGEAGSYFAAFISGLIAGVVASPCVGPVLVSILAYVAQTQDTVLGFSLLFVFALGLGQLFIVLGTFSQLMQRLPRSGPWLGYVKFVFGSTMIAMAIYFAYPIFRPWLSRAIGGQKAVSECSTGGNGLTCEVEAPFAKPAWKKYSLAALNAARAAGKPVIIDFKAEWCEACHELERLTFSDQRVLALREYVWLEFNATNNSPELDELKTHYRILGLPFVAIYGADGKWREDLTLTGFEDANAFLARLARNK
jgi:thioredoxin:protein disulfide reductase